MDHHASADVVAEQAAVSKGTGSPHPLGVLSLAVLALPALLVVHDFVLPVGKRHLLDQ